MVRVVGKEGTLERGEDKSDLRHGLCTHQVHHVLRVRIDIVPMK